jgi:hypothetical protein
VRKIDPILKLLLVGILFFTATLLYCQKWFPGDGQTFQVIAGLLTGFAGAFLGFAKKELGVPDEQPPLAHRDSVTTTVTAESSEKEPGK